MEQVHVSNQLTRMDIIIGVAGGIILAGIVSVVVFFMFGAALI